MGWQIFYRLAYVSGNRLQFLFNQMCFKIVYARMIVIGLDIETGKHGEPTINAKKIQLINLWLAGVFEMLDTCSERFRNTHGATFIPEDLPMALIEVVMQNQEIAQFFLAGVQVIIHCVDQRLIVLIVGEVVQ